MKKQRKQVREYAAVFEPDEERGGYTVYIPALPGCISEGDTFEQAAENIREAAELYLEVMKGRRAAPARNGTGFVIAPVRVTA
ncbi:MAG: type II toxin-antitoxin system HicB family antitoxin [bacterium]